MEYGHITKNNTKYVSDEGDAYHMVGVSYSHSALYSLYIPVPVEQSPVETNCGWPPPSLC